MANVPERITLKKLWADLLEQLNLERGMGYTVKQFLIRPGRAVQEYLYENREKYMKPFNFLLLTTAVTTFLMVKFVLSQNPQDITDISQSPELAKLPQWIRPGINILITTIKNYFNLYYLSNLPAVAIASYWVLKKRCPFNLAEFFVITTFVFSIQSILYLLNMPFFIGGYQTAFSILPTLLLAGYFVFSYKQIYQLNIWKALFYSMLIYLFAQILNLVLFGVIILIGTFYA